MRTRRTRHALPSLAGLLAGLLAATAGAPARADIVDELNALADSLDVWFREPPAAWVADTDSVDLGALFPGAEQGRDEASGRLTIRLPVYMDTLPTGLDLALPDGGAGELDLATGWRLPHGCDDGVLLLDGQRTPCQKCGDPRLGPAVAGRLTWLRTLGLPRNLAAPAPADSLAAIGFELRMHPTRSWRPPAPRLRAVLAHLAREQQVYAGVLACDASSDTLAIRSFALLTHPEMTGHHFLVWNDRLSPAGDLVQADALLIPFIRTDNLKDLFDDPRAVADPAFRVRIRR